MNSVIISPTVMQASTNLSFREKSPTEEEVSVHRKYVSVLVDVHFD